MIRAIENDSSSPAQKSSRGQQLSHLRTLVLPTYGSGSKNAIAPVYLKAVMRCIDDHSGEHGSCWASQETIAEEANMSERAVRRALVALVEMGIVAIDGKYRSLNWDRIAELCVKKPDAPSALPVEKTGRTVQQNRTHRPTAPDAPSAQPDAPSKKPDAPSYKAREARIKREMKREGSESAPPSEDEFSLSSEEKPKTPRSEVDPKLIEIVDFWNSLKAKSLVLSGASTDPISRAVLKGWGYAKRDSTLMALFKDLPAIEAAIVKSDFVRKGWFRCESLFTRNKGGEFILQKLLDGGYADSDSRDSRGSRPARAGVEQFGIKPENNEEKINARNAAFFAK